MGHSTAVKHHQKTRNYVMQLTEVYFAIRYIVGNFMMLYQLVTLFSKECDGSTTINLNVVRGT